MGFRIFRRVMPGLLLVALAACTGSSGGGAARAPDGLPELTITVFAAPSQSIWLPTLIQELKLDRKQGFHLRVNPKPGRIAYADFATGADPVCYCAAPAAVARFVERGADITLLWNVFNLDYFIVSGRDDVRTVADLAGKRLGADTGTGSWAITAWLLQRNGLDPERLQLRSLSSNASVTTELALGRLDAALAGVVNLASLSTSDDGGRYRVVDLHQEEIWRRQESSPGIPSIAFGVWRPWLADEGNRALAGKFYRANLEAAAYLRAHPREAARIISARTAMPEAALAHVFEHNADIIDIRPISEYRGAIRLLTQRLLPEAGLLERPLTDRELDAYVSDFQP